MRILSADVSGMHLGEGAFFWSPAAYKRTKPAKWSGPEPLPILTLVRAKSGIDVVKGAAEYRADHLAEANSCGNNGLAQTLPVRETVCIA